MIKIKKVSNILKFNVNYGSFIDSLTTTKKSGASKQTYSEEKFTAVAEAFALSDICTGRKGKIPATEICNAMRMLGQCPTQLEVNEVIIEVEMLRRRKQAEAEEMAKDDKKRKRKKKGSGRRKQIFDM